MGPVEKLNAEFLFELELVCKSTLVVGANDFGYLRVITIDGGHFHGCINGTVVPGGADWNTCYGGAQDGRHFNSKSVSAKYLLQTDDGVYITIENSTYIKNDGDPPPYIRSAPVLHAPHGKYEWINYGAKVATLYSQPSGDGYLVHIKIYLMK